MTVQRFCDQAGRMDWKPETYVAVYAACVATGALMVQIVNWLRDRPRLKVSVIADGVITGGDPKFDERRVALVNVTNIGSADTLITNLGLEYRPFFPYFWRKKLRKYFVVLRPELKGYPPNVPHVLEPARQWTGVIRKRQDLADFRDGRHFAVLYTSNCKPVRRRIKRVEEKTE